MIVRFEKTIPGLLFRGSAPQPSDIPMLKDAFKIEQIISLDDDCGKEIEKACEEAGLKHLIIPVEGGIDDASGIIENNSVVKLVGTTPTYVHCKHGKDRTGMFVAKYRVESGESVEDALKEALKFGFGAGMDPSVVRNYIDIVSSAKDEYFDSKKFQDEYMKEACLCNDCGLLKSSDICSSCMVVEGLFKLAGLLETEIEDETEGEKAVLKSKNIVDESKENVFEREPQQVSSIYSVPETDVTVSHYFRRHLIKYMNNELKYKKADEQITFKIPVAEKEYARKALNEFDKISSETLKTFVEHLDRMYQPFTDYKGITPEQSMDASMHFNIFSKYLQDNLIDLKKSVYNSLEYLKRFDSASEVISMLNSIDDTIRNIDKLVQILREVLEELNTKDFQTNAVAAMDSIKKECAQLKQLISETITQYIRDHILGEDWTSEIKEEIHEDQKEQNEKV